MSQLEAFTHKKVVVLRETDTALIAAKAMKARSIGCVVVADRNGHITGLVTDRDLVNTALAAEWGPNTRLRDFMTTEVRYVFDDATISDVVAVMKQFGVRRVPVIKKLKGDHYKCVGIVTLDDLLVAQALSTNDLAQIVKSQIYLRHAPWRPDVPALDLFLQELNTHLPADRRDLLEFAASVFESLFRRLHYSSAIQFMLQLPNEFQKRLVKLPAGPDQSVTAEAMATKVCDILRVPREGVPQAVQKLWLVLGRFADGQELENVMNQLPSDIQTLFLYPSPAIHVSTITGRGGF